MRAWGALRAAAFQLAVGAGLALRAVPFQLAVGAGGALRALAFHLAVGAGGALRALAFQLPMGARVALRAISFLPPMRAPFLSHLVSCPTVSRRFQVRLRAALASSQPLKSAVSVASEASVAARHESAGARSVVRWRARFDFVSTLFRPNERLPPCRLRPSRRCGRASRLARA